MINNKLIELLKTGNFTVIYDDNGSGRIHKGHGEYVDFYDEDKEEYVDFVDSFDETLGHGYIPTIVCDLIKALGGKFDSI